MPNQPPLNPDALSSNPELFVVASTHHFHGDECLCGFKSARSRDRTEHIMLHTLAAVQPEVTSVESIPAKMRMLMWEGGEFEVGEIPEGYVLVGFEMETDRSWSTDDKVTVNIERPEVKS